MKISDFSFLRRLEAAIKETVALLIEHRCESAGCWKQGERYELPQFGTAPAEESYHCREHARDAGFCYSCGGFFAGFWEFDTNPNGLCLECQDELRVDLGEFDQDEELSWEHWP